MRYASIVDGIVDCISFVPRDGFIDVDDVVFAGFAADDDGNGGYIFTPPPPADPAIPSTPTLIATALIKLADGDIAAMSVSSLLAGAFRIDVGMYYVFFANPQPDTDYLALAYDSGTHRIFISETDKATDYFIVNATDFTGTASDPASLSIEIKRVQ